MVAGGTGVPGARPALSGGGTQGCAWAVQPCTHAHPARVTQVRPGGKGHWPAWCLSWLSWLQHASAVCLLTWLAPLLWLLCGRALTGIDSAFAPFASTWRYSYPVTSHLADRCCCGGCRAEPQRRRSPRKSSPVRRPDPPPRKYGLPAAPHHECPTLCLLAYLSPAVSTTPVRWGCTVLRVVQAIATPKLHGCALFGVSKDFLQLPGLSTV